MEGRFKPDGKAVIVLATVLLVGLVVGGIGFVLGRDSSEPAQAQSVVRAHETEAVAAARRAGYRKGLAEGRKAAAQRTAREDRASSDDGDGGASGHNALAVDDFSLGAGYYVVHVGDDGGAIDYAPMEQGDSYELCDSYGVCRQTR